MMVCLEVPDIPVRCIIGVRPDERNREQSVLIDLRVAYNGARAVAEDRVEAGLDYSELVAVAQRCAREGCYGLIEALAVGIAEEVLSVSSLIEQVEVRVRKPGAVAGAGPPSASVEIVRKDRCAQDKATGFTI
jgi:dihydroneopterin aldolase